MTKRTARLIGTLMVIISVGLLAGVALQALGR